MQTQKVTSTNIVAYFVPLSVTKHSHCSKDGKMTIAFYSRELQQRKVLQLLAKLQKHDH
jgi:hypothetical protein